MNFSEVARRHGIRPSKRLGQHFLIDPNTIDKIIRLAEVSADDRILEVGGGMGILTAALALRASVVISVELDRGLLAALEEAVGPFPNVTIVRGDAMKLDYSALLPGDGYRFISNLPYNIATPLIARLLESTPQIDDFVIMVQKEVGERLVSKPGSKQYGSISVLVRFFGEAKVIARVPPTVFWPRPKVASVVVRIVRREPEVDVSFARLNPVVRAAFGQRRKTIRNSLTAVLGLSGTQVGRALTDAGIASSRRAETLSLEDFARIAEALG